MSHATSRDGGNLMVVNIPSTAHLTLPAWVEEAGIFPAQSCARTLLVTDSALSNRFPEEFREIQGGASPSLHAFSALSEHDARQREQEKVRRANVSKLLCLEGRDAYQYLLSASLGLEGREVGSPHSMHDLKQSWQRFNDQHHDAAQLIRGWIEDIFRDSKLIRSEILCDYRHSSVQHVALELSRLTSTSKVIVFAADTPDVSRLVRLLGNRNSVCQGVEEILLVDCSTDGRNLAIDTVRRDLQKGALKSRVEFKSIGCFMEDKDLTNYSNCYVCTNLNELPQRGRFLVDQQVRDNPARTALFLFRGVTRNGDDAWHDENVHGLVRPEELGRIYQGRRAMGQRIIQVAVAACQLCAERRISGQAPRRSEIIELRKKRLCSAEELAIRSPEREEATST